LGSSEAPNLPSLETGTSAEATRSSFGPTRSSFGATGPSINARLRRERLPGRLDILHDIVDRSVPGHARRASIAPGEQPEARPHVPMARLARLAGERQRREGAAPVDEQRAIWPP
jgi:hypothetical protein